ncbi:hypothetical protein HPP92_004368 [Vanilla planifolia]|uniref:Uncharacterized protein n=1 Tax=Vanilla planifolia TaxID=51239 RepID=A0A835S8X1_VANPL|nr:hypothetical protein HPP92_004368 [Vanilla planifolia]
MTREQPAVKSRIRNSSSKTTLTNDHRDPDDKKPPDNKIAHRNSDRKPSLTKIQSTTKIETLAHRSD